MKRRLTEDKAVSPPPIKKKVQSTTTQRSVSNFFLPASQKPPELTTWRIVDDSLLTAQCLRMQSQTNLSIPAKRVAGFDFDSTLVTTISGNRFAKDAADWKWWHPSVPAKIREMSEKGYEIVVFSNQGGISLKSDPKSPSQDQKNLTNFKIKANAVLAQLNIPIRLYAATARDRYRKPRLGMWAELLDDMGLATKNSEIDLDNSIFVGDAGGRVLTAEQKASKDFASSDRDFAANIGLSFKTPEEFFLGEPAREFARTFDPTLYIKKDTSDAEPFQRKHPVEVVVFCGSPGAGKSTFYFSHMAKLGYERINQDILKTRERCLKKAAECLKAQQSVAIDATNANVEVRRYWINLGRQYDTPVRCVHFMADARLCEHNDAVRALNGTIMNPESRTMLPRIAFTSFASRYQPPTLAEGFEDIYPVNFAFQGTAQQESIWSKYWI